MGASKVEVVGIKQHAVTHRQFQISPVPVGILCLVCLGPHHQLARTCNYLLNAGGSVTSGRHCWCTYQLINWQTYVLTKHQLGWGGTCTYLLSRVQC